MNPLSKRLRSRPVARLDKPWKRVERRMQRMGNMDSEYILDIN